MEDCIFCKIIAGKIPSKKVYEDDHIFAFHDIKPAAPVHVICVPKIHVDSLDGINHENIGCAAHILEKIPEIAKTLELFGGYRVVVNVGEDGGMSVNHLHFHIMGGKKLSWYLE